MDSARHVRPRIVEPESTITTLDIHFRIFSIASPLVFSDLQIDRILAWEMPIVRCRLEQQRLVLIAAVIAVQIGL